MKPKQTPFKGVIVPMITPLNKDLSLDIASAERILDAFLAAQASAFLLGTTGESVSLSGKQKTLLVQTACGHLNRKIPIYAGISGNCLAESIEQAKLYADYGVDAVVAHLPFFYPLSADQMSRYFAQLADGVPCPLVLYNIPITTKQSIPVGVIDQLSHHPNIAGIKDSERGLERLDQSAELWADRTDFVYLMGCAAQSAIALQKGADGIVPSFGNVAPGLFKRLFEASLQGDYKTSEKLQAQADTISEIYQKDKNLGQSISALKIMMSAIGLCQPYVMPPLECLDADEQNQIKGKTMAAKRIFPEFLSEPV